MDCSLLGFSIHGIFQATLLEWDAIAFSPSEARKWKLKVAQAWWLFVNPWTSPWTFPGQNTERVAFPFSRGIFPTQGLNPGLPHCRQIFLPVIHKESPRILEWVAYLFSRGSSQPRNRSSVVCIGGGFFTNWVMREAHRGKSDKWLRQ